MSIETTNVFTRLIAVSVTLFCLTWGTNAKAADTAADALTTTLKNYHTLQADFDEKTLDATGATIQTTAGDMAFQRPELFRWYTESPSRQLIINKGDKLAIYDVDLEQVTYKNVDEQYGATPALLLNGDIDKLKQHYTITTCETKGKTCYQLTAKEEDDVFETLKIIFNQNKLTQMIIDNNLDQTTEIDFKNVKINTNLPAKLFALNLPDDVDVVQ